MIHARAQKATVFDLSPVVPARSSCRRPSTHVPAVGVPGGAAEKDAGELAGAQPGVCGRLPHPAARGAGTTAGTPAGAAPFEPPWDLAKDAFGPKGADFIG